ncbi:MAG: pyruvate formate-lyase [Chloroflexi bacterium]|nr:pyruvate formate-lyase [Chloroflexota bacterium]
MGTEVKEKTLSKRVAREKEALLTAAPRIDLERDQCMVAAYRETDGLPMVIRQGRFFNKLCTEKTIFIDDNPIVGTLTKHRYGSYPLMEIGPRWMKGAQKFRLPLGFAEVTDDERAWIDKAVVYWKDRNIFTRTRNMVLESTGVDIGTLQKTGVATESNPGGLMSGQPDYAWVLNKGLNGVLAEIAEEKRKIDFGAPEGLKKRDFLEGAELSLKGMITLAKRYAALAREMAAHESDAERKAELERIAEICDWVPANPARNFREAIQSAWFVLLGNWFQTPNIAVSAPARFPQYMYPLYKKDKEEGRITEAEAIELMQFYFLKVQALGQVLPPLGFKYSQSRVAMQLSIGGLTPNGRDATNEVDWLVLEAKCQLMIPEPLISLLYHDELAEDFLMKCVELIRTGIGQPSFHDARKLTARSLYHRAGVTLEDARNQCVIACVQDAIPGYTDGFWEGNLNTAKMIELVLNNGIDPLTGTQIGPKTGEIESFRTYDDLHRAVIRQLEYFVPLARKISRTAWSIERDIPVPYCSALVHDCIQKGKDLVDGGARYSLANGTSFVGTVDLANSLVAIKTLVFEKKRITLKDLKEALAADFEGYEDIQRMCLDAPKYGNGDEAIDSVARELFNTCWKLHQTYPDFLGRNIMPEAYSVSSHAALGELTGALPNGRKARTALTDASVSAQHGTDKNGPTALVTSAARVIDTIKFGSNHFNMRFHPTALKDAGGVRKFLALMKTYMDMGGYHAQFNCVDARTLRAAQENPDQYRNLIVRVAGFSAYFALLDKIVQDEIIERTELKL